MDDEAKQREPSPVQAALRAWARDKLHGGQLARHGLMPALETQLEELCEELEKGGDLGEVLDAWFFGMANTPLSRDTEAWNEVHAALPALEAALTALAKKED
jgi:hypothetical protein